MDNKVYVQRAGVHLSSFLPRGLPFAACPVPKHIKNCCWAHAGPWVPLSTLLWDRAPHTATNWPNRGVFFLINLSSLCTLHNHWLSCSTELDGWWPRYVPCLHTDTWKHPDVFSKEKSFAQTALAVSSSTQRTRAVCQPCEALAWCKLAQVIKAGQGVKARCHQLEQVFKQGNNILARATEQPQRKAEKS